MIRKISTFNSKSDRKEFQAAALKAIAEVAKQYGMSDVQNAGYVYDDLDCTFKFKVMCDTATPIAQYKNLDSSRRAGFTQNVVGQRFRDRNHTFTITGFSFGRKNVVDCTRSDGKIFSYNAGYIKTFRGLI